MGKKTGEKSGKKPTDLRPKHFRGSSLDVREAEAERKKKEAKLKTVTNVHNRTDSIGIDALMKTLGTDDLFAIHVGGQGRQRGSSDAHGGGPVPYKPTIGLAPLSEDDDDGGSAHGGEGGLSTSQSSPHSPSSTSSA